MITFVDGVTQIVGVRIEEDGKFPQAAAGLNISELRLATGLARFPIDPCRPYRSASQEMHIDLICLY